VAADHPLLICAVPVALIALGHAVWVVQHRQLGAYDPDEAGYIATALRYQRSLDLNPLPFIYEVGATGTGPLVPLLSVPLLILGPRSPHTVMMVQPILLIIVAIAAAGIAQRLSGSTASVVAGVATATTPTITLATQSYWFGLGTAAACACAMWALVSSDRGTNRWIWAYGIAVGLMLLARTMALGLLPAMIVAGVIVVGPSRRGLTRFAGSLGLTAIVAGPWWVVEWSTVSGYLVDYGYGERAGLFGSGTVIERVGFRFDRIRDGIGAPAVTVATIVAAIGLVVWLSGSRGRPPLPPAWREFVALTTACAAGVAALSSTTNNGVWFELPIVVIVVPLAVAALSSAPRLLRWLPALPFAGMVAVQLASAWWFVPPGTVGVRHFAQNSVVSTHYEEGFAQYDPRFAPGRRGEHAAAAADWYDLSSEVEQEMQRIESSSRAAVFTLSGNMQLFNSNSIALVGELRSHVHRIWIPDTTLAAHDRSIDLSPLAKEANGTLLERDDGEYIERVLVVALHDRMLFTPDRDVAEFAAQATAAGWRVSRSFEIPGGGTVEFLRHSNR